MNILKKHQWLLLAGLLVIMGVLIVIKFSSGDNGTAKGKTALSTPTDWKQQMTEDFANTSPDWEIHSGEWVTEDEVLKQLSTSNSYPLILYQAEQFDDVDISVKFRPLSGRVDASGGLVFRAVDAENYYIVRANSLENNFRLYAVVSGNRRQIASATVTPPTLGEFSSLRVVAIGDHIQAYFNGELLLDYHDSRFEQGYVGLWTKADAVTDFDDF